MFQDPNKGKTPKVDTPEVTDITTQAAGILADKAAAEAGEKVKEAKDKVQQAGQIASQAAAYTGAARQMGSAFTGPAGPGGPTPGINDTGFAPQPQPISSKRASNSVLMAAHELLGVSHLTKLTIVVEGTQIKSYKNFHLSQTASEHHQFSLVLDHDSLGDAEDHQLEKARKLLGKRILVTFAYKNIPAGPERDFIGVITKVGLSRENRNHGNIVLSGHSPTILLDGAPHIQSFGGNVPVSLNSIAHMVLEQGLGSGKYAISADSRYENVAYSCQYEETHYNYLARLAESYGEQFYYDGQTVRFGKLPFAEKAIQLVFGKNVDEVDISIKALHVNPSYYGYSSSDHQGLSTGKSTIKHVSSLGKAAYDISQKTFMAPSLRVAPLKARTSKDLDAAQDSTAGSTSVTAFTTSGRTSTPFLYPGCVVDMEMLKPGTKKSTYFTRLMIIKISHSVDKLGHYTGHFEAIGADTGYLPRPVFREPKAEPQFATVISNDDDMGRIQVRFDWQGGGDNTEWIRVLTPDAGSSGKVSKNRGFVFIPEVGDQVMVGFVHSHPDRPYVMGGLFHGKIGSGGGKGNNIKSLSSKSGNKLELNDKEGSVYLTDHGGANMKFDGGGNATTNANSNHTVNAGSTNVINVGAKKDTPPQSVIFADSSGNVIIDAKTSITLLVGGNQIKINKEGIITIAADGKIESTAQNGSVTIKSITEDVTVESTTAAAVFKGSTDTNIGGGTNTFVTGTTVEINQS